MAIGLTERTGQRGRLRASMIPALILALIAMPGAASPATSQPLDSIVAVVNDDVIAHSELDREIALLVPQLEARGAPMPAPAELREQALERLIRKRLQDQRARALGIVVDDAMLTQAMTSIAARNGLSLDALRQTLEAGGIGFDDFREDTRAQLLTSQLQAQEVVKNIRVTDAEIDRFLAEQADSLIERTEVRLSHILIALPEAPTPEQVRQAEQRTQDILKRLRQGEDFAALARAMSEGHGAREGGDLGWFPLAEVPSLAAKPARALNKGEVSEPIRSPSGLHLIKLTDIKGNAPAPLTQTHARHILIRANELVSDADARQRLAQLRLRLVGGDDFGALARAHSDDTGSALKGGDLGWISPGDTVPAFEDSMARLAPNDISQPFQTPFGWHIVQVMERRQQDTADEVMRLKATDAIRARKAEEAIEVWLQRLRDEAFVEVRIEREADED